MPSDTVCLYHSCSEPNPQHVIVWRCPVGHRIERWYCGAHIARMAYIACERPPGYGRGICEECWRARPRRLNILSPVLEA